MSKLPNFLKWGHELYFLGAFLGAIGSLAGAFGGGGGNGAALQAADQRAKLQAATQRANEAARNKQRADEVAVGALGKAGAREVNALAQLVSGFRQSLLSNPGSRFRL